MKKFLIVFTILMAGQMSRCILDNQKESASADFFPAYAGEILYDPIEMKWVLEYSDEDFQGDILLDMSEDVKNSLRVFE